MKLTNKLTIKLKRHPHLTEPDNRAWWSSDSGIRTLSIMLLILAVMVIAIPPGGQAYITPVNAQKQNRKASGQAADKYQAELTAAVKSMQSEAARMERTETAKDHFTKLAQKMQSVQTMAVIIRLRLPYRTEVEVAGGVQSDAQRLMIRQVRERLLDQLAGYEPSSVKSYDYLPLVALRLNVAGMNSIQGLADALDIEEDEVLSPSLDQSSAKIGAVQAWADGYTGTGQTIAIIDSGVDKSHPFLANKVVSEACYSTTNSAYFATSLCPGGVSSSIQPGSGVQCSSSLDGCSHGTHVAGIAAGKGASFSGVARDANIISIQVFSRIANPDSCRPGVATCIRTFSTDLLLALERIYELKDTYAIAAINGSLGGGKYTTNCDDANNLGKLAIDLLRSAGIATVIASGNDGYIDGIGAPACISSAISVGSTDTATDRVSEFSNTAPFLHLLAPGGMINSSLPGGQYGGKGGTSMATPHVAGAWALMRQKNPNATVTEIYNALATSGVPVTDYRVSITKPRIQVDAALRLIAPAIPPLPPPGNLVAVLRGPAQLELSWSDNSATESGFRVRRRTVEVDSWTVIATLSSNSNNYIDNDVVPGRTYLYSVVAFDLNGDSSPSNQVSITLPNILPAVPSVLRAVADSPTQITLNWTRNSTNETGFRIFRRTDPAQTWQAVSTTANGVTSFSDSGLSRDTTYYYRVTAFNDIGESAYSNEVTAKTPVGDRAFVVVTYSGFRTFDFGRMPIGREPSVNLTNEYFYIENITGEQVSVTLRISRLPGSSEAAKIVNTDDSPFFPVVVAGSSGILTQLQFIDGRSVVRIAGGQRLYFRISFRPLVPAPAGRTDNLAAGHLMSPAISSRISFDDGAGPLDSLELRGQIETKAMLINPFATRLSPLVALARTGDLIEAEFTLFDPNLDAYQASYQFYDRSGKAVGQSVNVPIAQAMQASGMLPGQSFTLVYRFTVREGISDINSVRVIVYDREGNDAVTSGVIGEVPGRVVNVSAASFAEAGVARGSISSAFGQGLAATVQTATDAQLPSIISGTRIIVRDSANVERSAPLYFVAPGQINYQIPEGTTTGQAVVTVIRDERVVAVGPVEIAPTSPGIFTVNSSGQGLAAAQVLTVRADGRQLYSPVAEFDTNIYSFMARPIDLGSVGERVYLVLFGTGVRNRSDLSRVSAKIAGVDLPVLYAGPQPQYVGVDQINLLVPRSLAGRGEVDLEVTVDGRRSNTVRINIK